MAGYIRRLRDIFKLQSANTGWDAPVRTPVLSAEKRRQLLEATTLDTPRSTSRTILGVLSPYWTRASVPERTVAAALLATSLYMTWSSVLVTVDFGKWQMGLTNTVQQLSQSVKEARPDMIVEMFEKYPDLKDAVDDAPIMQQAFNAYPDMTSLLHNPEFEDLIAQDANLKDVLQKNSSLEELIAALPGIEDTISKNPAIMEQVTALKGELTTRLMAMPTTQKHLGTLKSLSGSGFFESWANVASDAYNTAKSVTGDGLDSAVERSQSLKKSPVNAWNSKDLATIALKFTAMAIISYKAAQYFAMRWRLWTTGYYTRRWTTASAYARMKNMFNNIDNPGQRIEQDPAKFTAGAVSLMTGGANAGSTLVAFSGQLWGMGPLFGVVGGFFWLGAAYAGALTGITIKAGGKLPSIQRAQQHRDADLRGVLDKIHANADLIAQNKTEDVERELVNRRLQPVMKNSVREISTQVKLILIDATSGNLSIPIPWVVGAYGVAAGTASMGTVSMVNYAFNRVTFAMSFVVNRFEQLSQMKATADRIYMFDRAIEAAHYIDAEKKNAASRIVIPKTMPDMKISGPGGV